MILKAKCQMSKFLSSQVVSGNSQRRSSSPAHCQNICLIFLQDLWQHTSGNFMSLCTLISTSTGCLWPGSPTWHPERERRAGWEMTSPWDCWWTWVILLTRSGSDISEQITSHRGWSSNWIHVLHNTFLKYILCFNKCRSWIITDPSAACCFTMTG